MTKLMLGGPARQGARSDCIGCIGLGLVDYEHTELLLDGVRG